MLESYGCILAHDHPVVVLVNAVYRESNPDTKSLLGKILKSSREAETTKKKGVVREDLHSYTVALLHQLRPQVGLGYQVLVDEALRRHERPTGAPRTRAPKAPPKDKKPKVNDETAKAMRGMSIEEMFEYASGVLGTSVTELASRSAHLNNGLIRMWLGNQVRKKLEVK